MSGPKCGEWSVQANLERERRIGEELRSSIAEVCVDIETLRGKWQAAAEGFGDTFPRAPTSQPDLIESNADNDSLNASLLKLRSMLAAWKEELADAESIHRIRRLLAASKADDKSQTENKTATQRAGLVDTEARKVKLSGVLSKLDPMVPALDRGLIEDLGKGALTMLEVAKFDGVLLEIRFLIQKHNQKCLEQSRKDAKIQDLLDRLTGLRGPAVVRLSQELLSLRGSAAKLRPNIEAEVTAIAGEATADDDRRYASMVLLEELEKLGYSTTSGMETVLVQGGELQVSKAELKEYAVCFSVDRDNGQFDVHLTRDADSTEIVSSERGLRDRSMEEQWCGDLASILSTAADRGVIARITKREKPGFNPVVTRHGEERRRGSGAKKSSSMKFPRSE